MLRENAGYGTDAAELMRMSDAAATFAAVGVDGLVVGFARGGEIMLDALHEVLQAARTVPATFHRAFDSLADPLRAIDTLSDIPQIDRILTDGGSAGDAGPTQRCVRLRRYTDRAGSRLTIIAGSRVDEQMLGEIARSGCVREVHVGRAAREGGQDSPVTAARVRRLRELID